jgi:hypothetical protein
MKLDRHLLRAVSAFALAFLAATPVFAGSHLWRINEVFSNSDGSVQFIELHECCGATAENFLRNLEFTSDVGGGLFRFPENLSGSTANRYLLLATARFAELPGAPQPDYIIPDHFFSLDGDTLWYSEARRYDVFRFGPGDLPTDGLRSIHLVNYTTDQFTTGPNSPTNYRGEQGSIDVHDSSFRRGDCNADAGQDLSDAVFLLDALFRGGARPDCADGCDSNDDGSIDISDAVSILLALFSSSEPLPAPQDCGEDPTDDTLGCAAFSACS